MPRTSSVIISNADLSPFIGTALKKWIKIIDEYSTDYDNDALYYYNERASLSIFAGALWLSGCIALEEYVSPKRAGKPGRIDMWFACDDVQYIVEAKQFWPSIGTKSKLPASYFTACIKSAVSDGHNSKASKRGGIGLAFLTPSLPPRDQKPEIISERIDLFLSRINSTSVDFIAYTVDANRRVIGRDKRMYPGAAVLGKIV